jgi:hypothetical protein
MLFCRYLISGAGFDLNFEKFDLKKQNHKILLALERMYSFAQSLEIIGDKIPPAAFSGYFGIKINSVIFRIHYS